MEKIKIFENSSLNEILTAINRGVVGVDDPENLLIISDEKPGIFIKHLIIDISDILATVVDKELMKIVQDVETELYEYIVFTVDTENKALLNMGLLEYSLIHEDTEFMDKKIWNLYDLSTQ